MLLVFRLLIEDGHGGRGVEFHRALGRDKVELFAKAHLVVCPDVLVLGLAAVERLEAQVAPHVCRFWLSDRSAMGKDYLGRCRTRIWPLDFELGPSGASYARDLEATYGSHVYVSGACTYALLCLSNLGLAFA